MEKKESKKEQFIRIGKELKEGFSIGIRDKKRWLTCLIEVFIAGILVAIDLITKEFIYGSCVENGKINIIEGVFSFTAVENTGAGFGIFANNTLALTIVSFICSIILIAFMFYSYKRRNLWLRSALILILGGAIGNIVDRIMLGYVRDFIYFELINFAVFNFADSCLTVGTIVLIIYVVFFYSKEEKELQELRKAQNEKSEESENTLTEDTVSVNNENENSTVEVNVEKKDEEI